MPLHFKRLTTRSHSKRNKCTNRPCDCDVLCLLPWPISYSSQVNFFTISYGWDVIGGDLSKLVFFEGGGSLLTNISGGNERFQAAPIEVEGLEVSLFCMVSRYW